VTGLLYLSLPRVTVGLVVSDGTVVEPRAPWARKRLGTDARQVWRDHAGKAGVLMEWIPDDNGGNRHQEQS
jgi:hypothetical protein